MRLLRSKRGIVGIEAAIVLIAFVVIAASLSYVVINMGFFATQKTKETINEGIGESTAALQLDGTVTARTDSGQSTVAGEVIGTGDGTTTDFTGTLAYYPVVAGTLTISDGTETFTDNGDGTLTGDATGTGTIDYETGAFSVSFAAAPTNGVNITAGYTYKRAGRIEHIVFPVKLSVGKADVDLGSDSVVVSVYLPGTSLLDVYEGCSSTSETDLDTILSQVATNTAKFWIYNDDGDTVLESKEKAFLVIHIDPANGLDEYETVKIEVKTGRGAALTVVRTAPGGMSANSYVDLG